MNTLLKNKKKYYHFKLTLAKKKIMAPGKREPFLCNEQNWKLSSIYREIFFRDLGGNQHLNGLLNLYYRHYYRNTE